MGKGEKRSFEQMEGGLPDYVLSTNDHSNLEKLRRRRPPFPRRRSPFPVIPASFQRATTQASFYVVPLISFSGDDLLSVGCGTIFETDENNNVVLTSLNLIRPPKEGICSLVDNWKIIVYLDDVWHVAEMCAYDFHYNLLFIKFKSKTHLQPAKLQLYPSVTTEPGDPVIVVGQYFYKPYKLMAAYGEYSMDHCNPDIYDCRELFSINCNFSQCGEGSPLINLSGEVLGMVYYQFQPRNRPVMPIHLIYKWWEHYKIYGEKRHPFYGFEVCDFYAAELSTLDRVIKQFPSISKGLVVEEVPLRENDVIVKSDDKAPPCTQSELCENDVIVKCDDKFVESFSELWDLIWEKVGQSMKLLVARIDAFSFESIDIPVLEASKVNNWHWFD